MKKHLTKEKIDGICTKLGLKHAERRHVAGLETHIWDGFVSLLNQHWLEKRGLVDKGEFPLGCYVTAAAVVKGEDRVFYAPFNVHEPDHNPELSGEMKKMARINAARQRVKHEAAGIRKIFNAS